MKLNKEIFRSLFIFLVFSLSAWNCSDLTNPILTYNGTLNGKWEEEFVWNSNLVVIFGGGKFQYSSMNKKSTIKFSGNHFEVKILPPNRIISSTGDSTFVTVSSDTIYTGSFKISGDTLKFYLRNQEPPQIFSYKFYGDSLHIQQLPKIYSSGLYTINMTSFLWGNSDFINAGVFTRIK